MRDAVKALLTSRKFIAMLAGIVVSLAARHGLLLPEREVAGIVGLFIAYILAQGQADKGKEAARIVACAGKQAAPDSPIAES